MSKKYPFKFLDSYSREDRDVFFGREEEIAALYEMVFQSDLVVVYGPSGSGKTSLIECGLANRFQPHDWMELSIRRGDDLNESLEKALDAAMTPQQKNEDNDLSWLEEFTQAGVDDGSTTARLKKRSTSSIERKMKQIYQENFRPIYLVFDQFEELFILGNENEEALFIQSVIQLLECDQPVTMIFSIREEYLGDLFEFEKQVPQLMRKKLRVEPMTLDKITQVIEGINCHPESLVHVRQGEVEAFAGILFEKIRGHDKALTIHLPHLQVFLDSHYIDLTKDESRTTEVEFSVDGLVATGDIEDVLREFLEVQVIRITGELNQEFGGRLKRYNVKIDDKVIWSILSPFASEKGTKEPQDLTRATDTIITRSEFLHDTGPDGKILMRDLITATVASLVQKRILRDLEDGKRFEIVHDSLAKRISEKRSDDEIALMEIQRMINNQVQLKEEARELFSEKQLNFILPFLSRLRLSDEERRFVNTSQMEVDRIREEKRTAERIRQERRSKRNKRWVAFGILTIFLMTGLTVLFLNLWRDAEEAKKSAENAALYAQEAADKALLAEQDALLSKATADSSARAARFAKITAEANRIVAIEAKRQANAEAQKARLAEFRAFEALAAADENRAKAEYARVTAERAMGAANFSLAKVFEEKATNAMGSEQSQMSLLYTLTALERNRDSTYTLPVSLGRVIDRRVLSNNDVNPSEVMLNGGAWDVAFDRSGRKVAIASANGFIQLLDIDSGDVLRSQTGHGSAVNDLEFSRNGKLASASNDNTIALWRLDEFRAYKTMSESRSNVTSISFHPDNQWLAASYRDGNIAVWDIEKGQRLFTTSEMDRHHARINDLTYSPDGRRLASASSDGTIQIWELIEYDLRPIRVIRPKFAVNCLEFTPDGRMIASGTSDGSLQLWNVATGEQVHEFTINRNNYRLKAHFNGVLDIDFSPDGKWLASGSLDQRLIIWSVRHRKPVAELEYPGSVLSFDFSDDMERMVVGLDDRLSMIEFKPEVLDSVNWSVLPYIDSMVSGRKPGSIEQISKKAFSQSDYELLGWDLRPKEFNVHEEEAGGLHFESGDDRDEHRIESTADHMIAFQNDNPGYPKFEGEEIILTPDGREDAAGILLYDHDIELPFTVSFEYSILNDDGHGYDETGDGIVFMFCKNVREYYECESYPDGNRKGFVKDNTGYGIHISTYGVRRMELWDGNWNVLKSVLYLEGKSYFPDFYSKGQWRKVVVDVRSNGVVVRYEGGKILTWEGSIDNTYKGIGFGAGTGGEDSEHRIRNVYIETAQNLKRKKMRGESSRSLD